MNGLAMFIRNRVSSKFQGLVADATGHSKVAITSHRRTTSSKEGWYGEMYYDMRCFCKQLILLVRWRTVRYREPVKSTYAKPVIEMRIRT